VVQNALGRPAEQSFDKAKMAVPAHDQIREPARLGMRQNEIRSLLIVGLFPHNIGVDVVARQVGGSLLRGRFD
jgi:hypothetical protein